MTTIRLKVEKEVFKTIVNMVDFTIKSITVSNGFSLLFKEQLEQLLISLQRKQYTTKAKISFSMNLPTTMAFVTRVGVSFSKAGDYECAVWHILQKEIDMQLDRAVQLRIMN